MIGTFIVMCFIRLYIQHLHFKSRQGHKVVVIKSKNGVELCHVVCKSATMKEEKFINSKTSRLIFKKFLPKQTFGCKVITIFKQLKSFQLTEK